MAISVNMLTCSAKYYTRQTLNADGVSTWEEPIELSNIYITNTRGESNGAKGMESADRMMLYYDCVNSIPKNISWVMGAKIELDGFDYYINSITPVYKNGIHHYEIGLV